MGPGVLVMAYGTPSGPDDIEAYYTHIRRGRPPTRDQLADLTARYEALGGVSPLAQRTEAQRAAIAAALPAATPVELGQKHAAPFIEDGLAALVEAETDLVVGLVLAPHFSTASVGQYHARAASAAADCGISYRPVDDWSTLDPWVDFQAQAVREALAALPSDTLVAFTAHSLPERVLDGDPYPERLLASAAAIADRADAHRWELAWQSAGRTPEPWRGPDILEVIDGVDAGGLLVCPQGFTSDHLEVLYDLDIEARQRAEARGLAFARTRSVNDDPMVMAGLAEQIWEAR